MEKTVYIVLGFRDGYSVSDSIKVFEHYQDAWAYSLAISTNKEYDDVKVLESKFY